MEHFEINDQGTVVVVTPLSDEAKQWVDNNVFTEPWQEMGDGFACEPRMVESLLNAFAEVVNE